LIKHFKDKSKNVYWPRFLDHAISTRPTTTTGVWKLGTVAGGGGRRVKSRDGQKVVKQAFN